MKAPTLTTIARVRVADVEERSRLRPVSEAGVTAIMASIAEVGVMKDAIHVRRRKDGRLVLIAGAHRLESARRLGWDEVEAKVWTDVTDDWARLMEIDDNLAGAELTPLDTAVFLATRKEVYERLHPETKRGVAGALARWDATEPSSVAFVAATASKFGMSERQVYKIAAAGSRMRPDQAAMLRAAPRPVTLKDLIDIAKLADTGERYAVIDALAEGRAKSAAEARRVFRAARDGTEPQPKDPVEEAFKALSTAWARAPMAAKKRFLLERAREVWEAQNKGAALTDWREAAE
ncbi:MAG: ParB N-terminal domain-containing protein [Gemmobacter sp.]